MRREDDSAPCRLLRFGGANGSFLRRRVQKRSSMLLEEKEVRSKELVVVIFFSSFQRCLSGGRKIINGFSSGTTKVDGTMISPRFNSSTTTTLVVGIVIVETTTATETTNNLPGDATSCRLPWIAARGLHLPRRHHQRSMGTTMESIDVRPVSFWTRKTRVFFFFETTEGDAAKPKSTSTR